MCKIEPGGLFLIVLKKNFFLLLKQIWSIIWKKYAENINGKSFFSGPFQKKNVSFQEICLILVMNNLEFPPRTKCLSLKILPKPERRLLRNFN